jgi:hypothetical protein
MSQCNDLYFLFCRTQQLFAKHPRFASWDFFLPSPFVCYNYLPPGCSSERDHSASRSPKDIGTARSRRLHQASTLQVYELGSTITFVVRFFKEEETERMAERAQFQFAIRSPKSWCAASTQVHQGGDSIPVAVSSFCTFLGTRFTGDNQTDIGMVSISVLCWMISSI